MRIHINTSPNTIKVPFNYTNKLVGSIHKWLGKNNYHGQLSMFSFSNLHGSAATKSGLNFPNGSGFFISSWNKEFIQQLVKGIMEDADIAFGLKATEVTIQMDPDLSNVELFQVASPVFIKRTEGERERHYIFSDSESSSLLTETMRHKMKEAGLPQDETLNIGFDKDYSKAKTKLITYGKVNNKVSVCPVIIKGTYETKAFAWNVGVGNSTGIGFGALR